MNRDKLILVLITVLVFSSGFFIFKFYNLKSQVSALTLRTKIAAKEKRRARTWEESKTLKSEKPLAKATATVVPTPSDEIPEVIHDFSAVETEKLMNDLQKGMKSYWRLNIDDINRDLAMAEELISRNPDVYSSHKAKLILMLAKENHLKAEVPETDIEQTLSTMAEFDIDSDKILQKEAFLIARTNKKIEALMDGIDLLEEQIETADSVEAEAAFEQQMQEKFLEMEDLENQIENGLLAEKDFLNEDVVEIPMYRALAKGDYDEVIEQAEALLESYPDSISGHFFIVRALQLSHDMDGLRAYLSNLKLSDEDNKKLEDRVNLNGEEDPREFWKRLRF
ncbi:MAG: hypothetical protein EP319_06370 [Deltaproteobacteria bacterium]|nr:MAG: hypothetical protein EP319_06370 [Deltaproteobacteria bacterium]